MSSVKKHDFSKMNSLSGLLIQSYLRLKEETNRKNEAMCKTCLTSWTAGQFTARVLPSNHSRRRRRQHQIERLQKVLKRSDKKKTDSVKTPSRLLYLQHQNNHSTIYACQLCKQSTKVLLWKPKLINRQENSFSAVASQKRSDEVSEEKAKKNKGKKKKTAGLLIPLKTEVKSVAQKPISMDRLSRMFQQPPTDSNGQMNKLNEFLK